jgi:hypothetical protein
VKIYRTLMRMPIRIPSPNATIMSPIPATLLVEVLSVSVMPAVVASDVIIALNIR